MKFKPVNSFVLVKPIEASNTTKSGLVLPETSLDKPNQGDVISVGDGQLSDNGSRLPVSVKVGDRVLYSKFAGIEITMDGSKYLILRDVDLLGTLEL